MGKVCKKCGYERKDTDIAPAYECPRCKVVYAKVTAAVNREVPASASYPDPAADAAPMAPEPGCGHLNQSADSDVVRELQLLIRSRYGLICIETVEQERVESLVKHLADLMGLAFFTWTPIRGLERAGLQDAVYETVDPRKALAHIEFSEFAAIYLLQGFGALLDNTALAAALTQVGRKFTHMEGALIVTGAEVTTPEEAKPYTAHVSLPPTTRRDYAQLLKHLYRDLNTKTKIEMSISEQDLNRLLNDLSGLTLLEAEKVLTKAMIEDGRLSPEAIRRVMETKKRLVEREGLLEYFPVEESMAAIADLAQLKTWLGKRKAIIIDPERSAKFGLKFPKGILLLGVPGCGKSLCAKAVATEWTLPLLRMDPSGLYNKYIGESEKNFKRAMNAAEKMAPVVLWIDEIEKVFATGGEEDAGVSKRVLAMFLSWMQDRRTDVFVVATSNDVTKLPAEFLRKGRFDEIFFVDLPDRDARAAIFAIHLRRRTQDPALFDLERLASASEGFSGAEIEQAVVAALYTACAQDSPLTTALLLEELSFTRPLSALRTEDLQFLRSWAKGRAVSAH